MPFSESFSGAFSNGPEFAGSGNFSGGSFSGAVGGFSVDQEQAEVITQLVGGGYNPSQGLYPYPPSKEEISKARERLGLRDKVSRAIAAAAARQALSLEQDKHKQFEELLRELELQGIEWDARYLQAMNALRERLMDVELIARLKTKLRTDDEMIVLMLLAASL